MKIQSFEPPFSTNSMGRSCHRQGAQTPQQRWTTINFGISTVLRVVETKPSESSHPALTQLHLETPSKGQHQMQRSSTLEVVLRRHLIVCPVTQSHQHPPSSNPYSTFPRCTTRKRNTSRVTTYICFPPKINRCCTGGIPSFSSTRSFMRETYHRGNILSAVF